MNEDDELLEDDDDVCPHCGGEGFVDEYEEDPINNDPGDFRPCVWCHGDGFPSRLRAHHNC